MVPKEVYENLIETTKKTFNLYIHIMNFEEKLNVDELRQYDLSVDLVKV